MKLNRLPLYYMHWLLSMGKPQLCFSSIFKYSCNRWSHRLGHSLIDLNTLPIILVTSCHTTRYTSLAMKNAAAARPRHISWSRLVLKGAEFWSFRFFRCPKGEFKPGCRVWSSHKSSPCFEMITCCCLLQIMMREKYCHCSSWDSVLISK